MLDLIEKLFPICRSITGDGVRETLAIINEVIPVEVSEIPTGTRVFDWEVPREWNVREAYIENSAGERIVDFEDHNLHLMSYSVPVRRQMRLNELKEHLHSLPGQPTLIPYRTSYYDDNWGFCLPHDQLEALEDDTYNVVIDTTLEPGHLTYGECLVPGGSDEEILVSTHICHPSLCNDNLSGIAVTSHLAKQLLQQENRYSYRFLFVPVTIGAISWLASNDKQLDRIRYGLVASNLGNDANFTYKKTRTGSSSIDHAVMHVLETAGVEHEIRGFLPYGYDERQYGSPGIGLDVGSLSRTPYGEYPEYHTSADNLSLVSEERLEEALSLYARVFETLENARYFRNLAPKGEPQLGRRGLYKRIGGQTNQAEQQMAILWLLNKSDGQHNLLDIARLSGMSEGILSAAADLLVEQGLLEAL